MPGHMQRMIVVVVGGGDAERISSVRFRTAAPFKWAFHQPAGSPSLPFTIAEVTTILVLPAAIALIVDMLKTPPRSLRSCDDEGIPLGRRETV